MAAIELWERADLLRKISSRLESRDVAGLLEQYAAEMDGAAALRVRCQRAQHEYERIASFL